MVIHNVKFYEMLDKLKWLRHAIFVYFQKLNGVFTSVEFQKQWSSFVIEDYLSALKLFTAVCCHGWQGWKSRAPNG